MWAQEFTHRTAETNINEDKQQEVVRVNASHIQFARNDLGSSVWSSLHQTQPGLRDSTILSFSHATFIHSRHDYMVVSSTNHAFSCTRLITVAQCKLQLSTNKMYYTVTMTKIANRIFHSESMSYSCILWCYKCVMGTSQQKHSEIAYALWVERFFNFIFFPIFFNLC
jgi:hypothetical protein